MKLNLFHIHTLIHSWPGVKTLQHNQSPSGKADTDGHPLKDIF